MRLRGGEQFKPRLARSLSSDLGGVKRDRRIRTIKVAAGTTLPHVYVDRRDREVPIRSAKSCFDIPDLATRACTSDATSARSESVASLRARATTPSSSSVVP